MNESASFLVGIIVSGEMTEEEADKVWYRLSNQPIPYTPSAILRQVRAILAEIRPA